MRSQWEGVRTALRDMRAVFPLTHVATSPYLWLALLVTCALFPWWSRHGWWSLSLEVLPSAMGFSLGAFAVVAGMADRLIELLSDEDGDVGAFDHLNSLFALMLVVQLSALLWAVLAAAWASTTPTAWCLVWWGLGALFSVWALTLQLGATLAIFQIGFLAALEVRYSQERKAVTEALKAARAGGMPSDVLEDHWGRWCRAMEESCSPRELSAKSRAVLNSLASDEQLEN